MLWVKKHTRENAYQHHSDESLIQLYQQTGKEIYVAELFQRYVDKVYIIARKYKVSPRALINNNPQISNPSAIRPGMIIKIPR